MNSYIRAQLILPAVMPVLRFWLTTGVALLLLLLSMQPASAHALRENYVWVNVEADHLSGRFEINVRDLRSKLGIDVDSTGPDRLAGVLASADKVQRYLAEHFAILDNGNPLRLEFQNPQPFAENPDFIQYPYRTGKAPATSIVEVQSTVFLTADLMKQDPLHRSVLVVAYNKQVDKDFGGETVALVFNPSRTSRIVDLSNPSTILGYQDFIWQGALQILEGPGHVLFLVVLLLTAVLRFADGEWLPEPRLLRAGFNLLVMLAILAMAHWIVFALAFVGMIGHNAMLANIGLAALVVVAAFSNLFPGPAVRVWLLIVLFGVFQGLAFASAMSELQFRNVLIHKIVPRFVIGVELVHLAVVALVFPLLFWLRNKPWYLRAVVNPVSIVTIIVAGYWLLGHMGLITI